MHGSGDHGDKNLGVEGTQKDFRSAAKKFWQTVQHLRSGKCLHVQLQSGKAPGVDEICPEYLNKLDVVELSWVIRLCNIAWAMVLVHLEWRTEVVVPIFKKRARTCVPLTDETHSSASLGRFTPGYWRGESSR